jgi:hypothetical protein
MDSRLRLADAGSVDRDPGGRPSDRLPAVLARKRQPQHGSSETLAAALPSGLVIMADAPDYSAGGEGRRPSRSSPRSS